MNLGVELALFVVLWNYLPSDLWRGICVVLAILCVLWGFELPPPPKWWRRPA